LKVIQYFFHLAELVMQQEATVIEHYYLLVYLLYLLYGTVNKVHIVERFELKTNKREKLLYKYKPQISRGT